MESTAYKDVNIISEQLYEESADKGKHSKKETGLKGLLN